MKCYGIAFAALVLVVIGGPQVYGQHIHHKHPTSTHDGYWKRTSLSAGPTNPTVTAGPSTWVVLVDHTSTNNDCEPATAKVQTTKSVTHTVTVGGGVTVGGSVEAAAGVLFSKVKATASASVTVNGSYSDSTTETVQISSTKTLQKCDIKKYTFEKLKKTASGTINTYDHKITCKHNNTGKLAYNYCNKRTLTGSGVGWGTTRDEWTNLGKVDPCPCDDDIEPVDKEELIQPVGANTGRR